MGGSADRRAGACMWYLLPASSRQADQPVACKLIAVVSLRDLNAPHVCTSKDLEFYVSMNAFESRRKLAFNTLCRGNTSEAPSSHSKSFTSARGSGSMITASKKPPLACHLRAASRSKALVAPSEQQVCKRCLSLWQGRPVVFIGIVLKPNFVANMFKACTAARRAACRSLPAFDHQGRHAFAVAFALACAMVFEALGDRKGNA